MKIRSLLLGAAMAGIVSGATCAMAGTPAFTTSGTVYDAGAPNDPVNLGNVFTSTANISVDALGFYDGTGISAPETVGIFNSSGTLLASVSVPNSGTTVSGYFFASITPVALTKGNQYTVNALTGNNDWNYGFVNPNTTADITYDNHTYDYTSEFTFPTYTANHAGGDSGVYYGPNFEYTTSGAIPEPSTWLMMLFGFVGLAFAGYRPTREAVSAAA